MITQKRCIIQQGAIEFNVQGLDQMLYKITKGLINPDNFIMNYFLSFSVRIIGINVIIS